MSEEKVEKTDGSEEGEENANPNTPETNAPDHPLFEGVISAIQSVFDPEIPVNIYELGLIYKVTIDEESGVLIDMTLTSPNCPEAQSLPLDVTRKISAVEGVTSAKVELVWMPPWSPDRMSEAAKLQLNFF